MLFNKRKCLHKSNSRRVISKFAFLGDFFFNAIIRSSKLLLKIAYTLKFEDFWKKYVDNNSTIFVELFTKESRGKKEIWDIAIKNLLKLSDNGEIYEFGTNNGGSLHYFWENVPEKITLHGFDCFEGIPEDWDSLSKGAIKGYGYPYELWRDFPNQRKKVEDHLLKTGEILSPPQKNIVIHKGLFSHSLSDVLKEGVSNKILLIHFDADIYMGTRPVLDSICGRINYKYFILFDEFHSVNHEFQAWLEFTKLFDVNNWKIIAASQDGAQMLIEVN